MLKLISRFQKGGYVVKKGDTFGSIAQKHGMSVQQLQQLNPHIKNIDRIREGDNIITTQLQEVKTVDGIRVPENINSVDLTPVNISKFSAITNQNGATLFIDNNLLTNLDNYLISRNVGLPQRQAILYNVVQEGSTLGNHGNGAYGLLGWRGSRIPKKGVNQMDHLYDTIFGNYNADHWHHGGAGSGYATGKAAQQAFLNAKTVSDALRALTYGYVRPDLTTRQFRSNNGVKYFQNGGRMKLIPKQQFGGQTPRDKEEIKKLQRELVNKGLLIGENEIDGFYGPKTQAAHQKLIQQSYIRTPRQKKEHSWTAISRFENEINSRDNESIINYYHEINATNTPYIVDDKVNNKLRVYINGQLIREYDAIHGKNSVTGGTFKKRVQTNDGEYTIKQGDTLSEIGKQLGVVWKELAELNNITDPTKLRIGQK